MNEQVSTIADHAREHGLHVAVAESLTCGALASRLGAGPEAATWLRGGVVAYHESVKFGLLGVTPGPVVTERCAEELASGVARVLDADVTVGATGVGGPDASEGKPAGAVIIAVQGPQGALCRSFQFPGDPEEVIEATLDSALTMLVELLSTH